MVQLLVPVQWLSFLKRPIPTLVAVQSALLGLVLGFAAARLMNALRIYRTAGCIPSELIARKGTIRGRVIAVADGDTIRIRHMPFLRTGRWHKRRKSEDTIQVRIAAVDSPELPHMGKPGQPLAEEAKQMAADLSLNRVVRVKLFARDQYSRVVGMVYVSSFRLFPLRFHFNLSIEMLRRGLAVVYRQGGAEYGGMLKEFEMEEKKAKRARKGVWKQKDFQLPGDFKSAHK